MEGIVGVYSQVEIVFKCETKISRKILYKEGFTLLMFLFVNIMILLNKYILIIILINLLNQILFVKFPDRIRYCQI
jgi:hypothetical protein